MTDLAKRKAQLLARLNELDVRLHDIEAELDAPHSSDWEESAIEREDDEVLERIGASGLGEVKAIRAALKRIEDGSYGICVRCGEDISDPRLDAVPATPVCRNCAA
ncbi:TraR/DksA family transcriptional regulator [Tranquillimonas alkanivorans]|uniref:Transcriptional regulator, TraR/DksA family n=1 Tax=Tranquillimonas alkanivorans TaxID=441119 RepID=A0A1I5SPU2_9RHOB|nr:TraR/DksA family transcriptional regulator [Tranquillimonas alkanivorans]SFP72780.1 transcriptional regulator, TraR/DksA family [Tranquillimonas alkanivorans]